METRKYWVLHASLAVNHFIRWLLRNFADLDEVSERLAPVLEEFFKG